MTEAGGAGGGREASGDLGERGGRGDEQARV